MGEENMSNAALASMAIRVWDSVQSMGQLWAAAQYHRLTRKRLPPAPSIEGVAMLDAAYRAYSRFISKEAALRCIVHYL